MGAAIETWQECVTFLGRTQPSALDGNDVAVAWMEMRDSLYNGMLHVMLTSTEHDGDVKVWPDGTKEGKSFFWKHEKSGYHGGLIFHPIYKDGVKQEVGRWSIHT
jgi:hypothetical protein